MKGYFVSKPVNVEALKDTVRYSRLFHYRPVEIRVIADIRVTLSEYIDFCDHMLEEREYLKPYAESSRFTENGADCVTVAAPGQRRIAVCLEGYAYPRYAAWPL